MNQKDFEDKYYLKYASQDLSKLHTKQLILILRGTYNRDPYSSLTPEQEQEVEKFTSRLKDELSKREHVPNKKEAKKIRQERAKRKS